MIGKGNVSGTQTVSGRGLSAGDTLLPAACCFYNPLIVFIGRQTVLEETHPSVKHLTKRERTDSKNAKPSSAMNKS